MYKIFSLLLLLAIVCVPLDVSYAGSQKEYNTAVAEQLTAIKNYLTRIFEPRNDVPLSHDELRELITSGAEWFIQAQEASGHFRYEYVPYEDTYLEDDHIARQSGVLYELGEIARRDTNNTIDIDATIESAVQYFESVTREDTYDGHDFSCITHNSISKNCHLGATNLVVTGILGYIEKHPEKKHEYEELLLRYVRYILAMQKPEGGFRDNHRIGTNTQTDSESAYSNGEALLALVRYYQFAPREEVREAIDKSFSYLKEKEYDIALYLWIMAALNDMHTLWKKEEYITYGKAFTNWSVGRTSLVRGTRKNYCAYSEGIVSAYRLLKESLQEEERAFLLNEVTFWNKKNSRLQLTEADNWRVIEKDGTLTLAPLARPERAHGGFLTSESDLTERIDFTQHCLSAYTQTLVDIEGEAL